jgi:N4-gp56 family major capsid protein
MAINVTTDADLAVQYQNYFSKKLLTYAVQALVLDQFGTKAPLPAKSGHKAISMFRWDVPAAGAIKTLTEGDTSTVGDRDIALTKISKTLIQRGQVVKLSDILNATDLFSSLQQSVKINGQDAALDMDNITRNILVGSNVRTTGEAGNAQSGATAMEGGYAADMSTVLDNEDTLVELYADGTRETTAADEYTTFSDRVNDDTLLDGAAVLNAVTQLKVNRAQPTSGGMYACVASPQVLSDLMQDNTWLNAAQYSNVEELYKGEVGRLFGAKMVTSTNGFITNGALGTDADRVIYDATNGGTTAANADVHASLFLGEGAYGVPELSSQSPFSPKIVITDGPDKSDPLNLTITAGFKCFWTALRQNPNYYVVMRSKTASTA